MTFEEAKLVLIDNRDGELHKELRERYTNINVLEDMILEALEYTIKNDALIDMDKRLKQGDIARLAGVAISVPYYLLAEKYVEAKEYAEAFVLLCSNYFAMYEPKSPVRGTFDTVSKLLTLEGNFTKLIVASQALVVKMEKLLDVSDKSDYGLSRQFISTMLNEHIDKI